MAEYGLGNFVYELTFDGKSANFNFRDPEDVTNTAEVSVSQDEFPAGVSSADAREVADYAYIQVAKTLNDKRDARLKAEAEQAVQEAQERDAHERSVANDFFDKSREVGDQPNYTDDYQSHDGTAGQDKSDKKDKKKK